MVEIVDSHFHIWDLDVLNLPWLNSCRGTINRSFSMDDFVKSYAKFGGVKFAGGVYVEVDCDDRVKEDEHIFSLNHPQILAKIMRAKLRTHMRLPLGIAGVREPLHVDSAPRGRCLESEFIAGLEALGERELVFESCNRCEELLDLYKACVQSPQTKVVLNHAGNVKEISSDYKSAMKKLASLPNLHVKLSGYATGDGVFVRSLLEFLSGEFGKSRLMYASNFPVISLYGSFEEHLNLLLEYFGEDADIFAKNAKKLYRINKPQRFASVIKIRPEKVALYKELHASVPEAVNRQIKECGISKYEIFWRDDMLFSIMEYIGDDFEYDMAKMAKDPATQEWWKLTDPCQKRIEDARKDEWWANMTKVYELAGLKKR